MRRNKARLLSYLETLGACEHICHILCDESSHELVLYVTTFIYTLAFRQIYLSNKNWQFPSSTRANKNSDIKIAT